jgi:hypothetical protein
VCVCVCVSTSRRHAMDMLARKTPCPGMPAIVTATAPQPLHSVEWLMKK